MKIEVYDNDQNVLLVRTNVQEADMIEVFRRYASLGDYTIAVEHHDETLLLIGIYESNYTLTILLSDGKAYDFTSNKKSQGKIDFVLGGQLIQWDRQFLVQRARVEATLEQFARNWKDLLCNRRWQKQV